jgi:uncharacterized protein with PQ loop repeat
MSQVFGWVAIAFSLTYKLPQIYVLCREKKHKGLSISSIIWQALGYIFYIVHGYIIVDWPILVMGAVAFAQTILLVILYFVYRDTE